MITRLLKKEEELEFQKVQSIAFEKEYKEEISEDQNDRICSEKIGVFHESENKLMGCLQVNEYCCRYDGKKVLLGGIGGVATLPQFRRNGVIRCAMGYALQSMYEKGHTFSYLYPFSMQYYRKFGFEAGSKLYEWRIPIKELPLKKTKGWVEQLFPGDNTSELLEIYHKFYQDYNLSVIREIYSEELEKENLLKKKRYVFLYRNEQGKATGFFVMNKEYEENKRIMQCIPSFKNYNDFLFLDIDAIYGMFSFIKQAFGSHYDFLKIALPSNICMATLVGENNEVQCQMSYEGMVRVVNVEKALSMCKCKDTGSVCVEISDEMLPQNQGRWKVIFSENDQNRVERTMEDPDISLSINDFSSLICGARELDDVNYMPSVNVHKNITELEKIFYRKKCHIAELF